MQRHTLNTGQCTVFASYFLYIPSTTKYSCASESQQNALNVIVQHRTDCIEYRIMFLIAVHCDITVWYMTSVMGTNRSIYLFTPERPRDLSARAPEPAPREPLSCYAPTELPRKETEQDNQSKVTLYTPTLLYLVPA